MKSFAIIFFIVWAIILLVENARLKFKVGYYEQKLVNRGVDIDRVKNMPFYKLWLN